MSSKKVGRFKFEEMLFSFKVKLATQKDFEVFIKESNKLNFYSSFYIKKISNYFREYYTKGLREFAESVLKDDDTHTLLSILDEKYLQTISSNELLTKIKEDYCSDACTVETKSMIKANINFFCKEGKKKKEVEDDNTELLLYLYLFSIIQSKKEKFYEETVKLILKVIKCNNVDDIMKLPKKLNINKINKEILLTKVKDTNINDLYVFLIKLLECFSKEIQEGETFRKFEEIKELLETYNIFSSKERKKENSIIISIMLNYFDSLNNNNEEFTKYSLSDNSNQQEVRIAKKKELFNEVYLFFRKYSMIASTENHLLQWFITNIQKHNIKLQDINENVLIKIGEKIANFEQLDKHLLSQILPKFLIQLISNDPIQHFSKLNQFYYSFKQGLNIICLCSTLPIEIKFTVFYFQLIYKQKNKERISIIKLNSDKNDLYFDIYCVFILLFPKAVKQIQTKELFMKMIKDFQENKEIHPFEYDDNVFNPNQHNNYSSELKSLNTYLQMKVINYSKLKLSIKNNNNQTNEYLNVITSNKDYNILFIEILNSDIPYFQEKEFLKSVDVPIDKKGTVVTYTLKGYFIIDKEKKKNILLYDKHSHCWYSIADNKWINHLVFQNDLLLITVVYLKNNEINQMYNFINFYGSLNKVESLKDKKERDYYWNLFIEIFKINPYLIKKDIAFYRKWFSLDNEDYVKQFITCIEKKDELDKDSKEKRLLLLIFKKVKNTLKDKIQQYIKKYFIEDANTFIHSLLNYLNGKENATKLFEIETLALNIEYYSQMLDIEEESISLQYMLVCYLSFIHFWNTQDANSKNNFWNESLKNISFLSSFKPECADKLCKQYLELVGNKSYIENIRLFLKTNMLKSNIDYKWKFLINFFLIFTIKEDKFLHFISLITNNKYVLSLNNNKDEDIKQCLIILHKYLKLIYKDNKGKYNELIEICFEIHRDSLQLSDLQREVLIDYTNYILSLLNNKDNISEKICNKITYISKFVLTEKKLERWFIKLVFIILQTKNSDIRNKIEPILLSMFRYASNKNITNIQFVIIYYFKRIKIEKQKKEIEQYKTYKRMKDKKDVHRISLSLGNHTQHIIQMISNKNFFKQFKETKNITFPIKILFNENEECKYLFENELKYIESCIKCNYVLYQEIIKKKENIFYIPIYPKIPPNNSFHPYIIYNYHDCNTYFPEEIEYSNNTYKLGGLIINYNESNNRQIILRNKSNLNWFIIKKERWEGSINSYLDELRFHKIISFYVLSKNDKISNNLSLKIFQNENIEQVEFTEDLKKIVIWFINNGGYCYHKYQDVFEKLFEIKDLYNLQNEIKETENTLYEDIYLYTLIF